MRAGARRSSPRVLFSGNANPGGCNEGRVGEERSWGCGFNPRRRTHSALGVALSMERRFGGWRKAQSAQGVIPRKLLRGGLGEGNGEERSPASGYVVSRRIDGNCASTMSVRSADSVQPEQGEAAEPLPVSNSYAAVVGKQPELVVRSNRRV